MDRDRGRSRDRRDSRRKERYSDDSGRSDDRRGGRRTHRYSDDSDGSRDRKSSRRHSRHRDNSYERRGNKKEKGHESQHNGHRDNSYERRGNKKEKGHESQHNGHRDNSYERRGNKKEKSHESQRIEEKIKMAELAGKAKRYEDVFEIMYEVAKETSSLSEDERHLLWTGLRGAVGPERSALNVISEFQRDLDRRESGMEKRVSIYKKKIASKIMQMCNDCLNVVDDVLLPEIKRKSKRNHSHHRDDGKVFYLKMKGDIYRYLWEIEKGDSDSRRRHVRAAEDAYERAYSEAKEYLGSADPLRLALILNYSVFQFELKEDRKTALHLSRRALEDADRSVNKLSDEDYKSSKITMASLHENIELWDKKRSPSKRR